VTLALIVAALWLVLHHLNLLPEPGEDDGALDLRAFDNRRADGRVRAVVYEKHLVKDNCVTYFPDRFTPSYVEGELLNNNRVALGDDILLPAGLDYGHFHSQNNVAFPYIKDKLAETSIVVGEQSLGEIKGGDELPFPVYFDDNPGAISGLPTAPRTGYTDLVSYGFDELDRSAWRERLFA